MNSRERLLTAIARGCPDRVPFTYDATAEADARFRSYLGLGEDAKVAEHFGCDRLMSPWQLLGAGPTLPERTARNRSADPAERTDIWGCRHRLTEAGNARYYEVVYHPLAHAETIRDVEAHDWPRPEEVVFPPLPPGFDPAAAKDAADAVIMDMSFIGPFGIPWAMLGLEKMMLDVALNPGLVEAVVAKVEEYTLGCLEIALGRYPGLFDLVGCGDDYGTQNSLMMSVEMIDRLFMPSLRRHFNLARRHGVRGYHHCCGAIFEIIPSLIEAGVEVLNPIQTSAHGMDPLRIKQAFGNRLACHGGIDIQQTIVHGTPDEVRAEVRSRIETLGPNGYILAPSHVLQPDTPPENLVALYEEAAAYRL